MTQIMKDEIKGTLHEAKGTVKEKVGQVVLVQIYAWGAAKSMEW